jgi:hypothetical protein
VNDRNTFPDGTLQPALIGTAVATRARTAIGVAAADFAAPSDGTPALLKEVVLGRIAAMSGAPTEPGQAELGAAVDALVEWCHRASVDGTVDEAMPGVLLAQARLAARRGVKLGAVLRCWFVALECLDDVRCEGGRPSRVPSGMEPSSRLLRELLSVAMCALAEAYADQMELLLQPGAVRRREVVETLLTGGETRSAGVELSYDLDLWHLGVAARGSDSGQALQQLARERGCQLLVIPRDDGEIWAWLGSRERTTLASTRFEPVISQFDTNIACGAPARAISGWRLTHEEAMAAALVGARLAHRFTRCTDFLLDAAILQSSVLAKSLADQYLAPLDELRVGGAVARQTLNAYYACDRSVSSAASLLRVTRKTVERRLRQIEEALGRPLRGCLELEVALRLEPT